MKINYLKDLVCEVDSFLGNKYAAFLLFAASFFFMLSAKVNPVIYAPLEGGIYNPLFDFYEVFPLSFFNYFLWILIFISLKSLTSALAKKHIYTKEFSIRKIRRKIVAVIALFFFLSWLPYFLAYYPGTAMQDEIFAMRDPFGCSNQPLLYNYLLTFLWDFGKFFGDESLGFGIFNILKMFVMALVLSYLLAFLYKRGISKYFLAPCVLMFAFLPIFPNYAICLFKDTPFSIAMLLLTLFLYENKNNYEILVSKKRSFFIFLLLSLSVVLLRGNGLHIMLPTVFAIAYLSKHFRFRFLALAVIIVLAGTLPNHGRKPPFKETVGVPIQQVARTINVNGKISEENKEIFNNVLKLSLFREHYVAFTVDALKWRSEFQNAYLNDHKNEFIKAWITTFPANASTYLTAHALATYDFWTLSGWQLLLNQTIFTHSLTECGLHNKNPEEEGWNFKFITSDRKILPDDIKVAVGAFMKDNVFYINGGVCGFILLISMAITLYKGEGRRTISTLPLLFAWGTLLLAAPIASAFRYVFYFALAMPFILSLPFMTEEKDIER